MTLQIDQAIENAIHRALDGGFADRGFVSVCRGISRNVDGMTQLVCFRDNGALALIEPGLCFKIGVTSEWLYSIWFGKEQPSKLCDSILPISRVHRQIDPRQPVFWSLDDIDLMLNFLIDTILPLMVEIGDNSSLIAWMNKDNFRHASGGARTAALRSAILILMGRELEAAAEMRKALQEALSEGELSLIRAIETRMQA